MVELFDWEENKCDYNLSISGIEPIEDFQSLDKEDIKPEEIIANQYKVSVDNVLIVHGAQEALFFVYLALKPSLVYIQIPAYPPFYEQAEALGIKFKFFENYENLRNKIIVISNPNNPYGSLVNLHELVENNLVIVDEIFKPFVTDEIFTHDNAILISSTSKFFNIKGIKVGWIVAKKEYIQKISKIKDLISPEPIFDKEIIKYIFKNYEFFKNRNKRITQHNYNILKKSKLNYFNIKYTENMPVAVLEKENLNSLDYCKSLLQKKNILLTPLCFFKKDNAIRIYLGYYKSTIIQKALEKINEFNSEYFYKEK
jgi:aspartate/methionine/tyrosine aminotransferase